MTQVTRTVIELDGNNVAQALAGEQDAHLKILERRLDCTLTLRGNVLILEGPDEAVGSARAALEELLTVIRSGRPVNPAMVESLMDIAVELVGQALRGVRRRRVDAPRPPDRAAHGQPEAVRRRHPQQHHHVRHRPGRHRQDLPGHGHGGERLLLQAGGAHHPHAAGGRGGGEPGVPAGHHLREGRPVLPAALRRALRHDGRREARDPHREGRDRGRAAGLHARPHPQRLVHHPRRGAEHVARADEDVPHAPRLRRQDGRHRRRHADRPAAQPHLGAGHGARGPRGDRGHRHHAVRRPRCGAAQAGAAHRQRVQGPRRQGRGRARRARPRPAQARPERDA